MPDALGSRNELADDAKEISRIMGLCADLIHEMRLIRLPWARSGCQNAALDIASSARKAIEELISSLESRT